MKTLMVVGIVIVSMFIVLNVAAAAPPIIGALLVYSVFFAKGDK